MRWMISPPAWGWTGGVKALDELEVDFPTRVGMDRAVPRWARPSCGFPHPRGDGPRFFLVIRALTEISPPAWGWTVL